MKRLIKSEQNELIKQIAKSTAPNPLVVSSGGEILQRKENGGDIITKIRTNDVKATGRQYMHKDGTPGKRTITFMEPDVDQELIDDVVFDPEFDL